MNAELLKKTDTAKRLGISIKTLDVLRNRGDIAFCKVGCSIRFRSEDIEKYISANLKPAR